MSARKRPRGQAENPLIPKLAGKKLGELSRTEMREIIQSLAPKSEMHTGIQFLTLLLDSEKDDKKAVDGVIEFVEKMHYILDKEGKFSESDFLNKDRAILKKSRIDLLSRRDFFRTIGLVAPGALFAVMGAAGSAGELKELIAPTATEQDLTPSRRNIFNKIYDGLWKYAAAPADLVLSIAVVYEGIENWKETKLEQVANSVAEMADAMEQQKKPAKTSAARG